MEQNIKQNDVMPLSYDCVSTGETVKKVKEQEVIDYLRDLQPYELRRVLCNVLYVGSYSDNTALMQALSSVIDAQ